MQDSAKFGKHNSIFLHPKPNPHPVAVDKTWNGVLERNPALKQFINPEYQHNYFDPPYDVETTYFIEHLNKTNPSNRRKALLKFLPLDLPHWKSYISKLPIAQIYQLREHIYISRIGDLSTNSPCNFSHQHWLYRIIQHKSQSNSGYDDNSVISASMLSTMPLGERLRWYEVAVQNVLTDAAEEEYLRYRNCMGGRMPFVEQPTLYNPLHYDQRDGYILPAYYFPPRVCKSIMGMIHDSHRHFSRLIRQECREHIQNFYRDLVTESNLDKGLLSFDGLQRCALGRELRARYMTKPPVLAGGIQFFGHYVSNPIIPKWLINMIDIRENDVIQYSEPDNTTSLLALSTGATPTTQSARKLQPLLNELQRELVQEGRLAPLPGQEHLVPDYIKKRQLELSQQSQQSTMWKLLTSPITTLFGTTTTNDNYYNDQSQFFTSSEELETRRENLSDIEHVMKAFNGNTPQVWSGPEIHAADGSILQYQYINQEYATAEQLAALATKYEQSFDDYQQASIKTDISEVNSSTSASTT